MSFADCYLWGETQKRGLGAPVTHCAVVVLDTQSEHWGDRFEVTEFRGETAAYLATAMRNGGIEPPPLWEIRRGCLDFIHRRKDEARQNLSGKKQTVVGFHLLSVNVIATADVEG